MKMVMESWVLMSLRGQWRIRYVLLCFRSLGCLDKSTTLSLPRRSRVSCVSSVYLPSPCLSPTFHIYLLHFSGYCKANDARRFILDVANARWPLTHFNRLNHSSDQSFYTHISMTPPSPDSSDNHTRLTNILTFVVIFSSTSNPIWLHLFHSQTYDYWNFTHRALLPHSRSRRKKRLINYITGVHPHLAHFRSFILQDNLKPLRQAK